jgi:hypothetical protein
MVGNRAQVQGPLLDVLPGGENLVGGEFAGDHAGVAGVLAQRAYMGLPFPGFLALADRLGVALSRRQRGKVQLEGQLIGGELIQWLGAGVAGGVLGHGRHHRPLVAGGLPPGCGDNPHQLVIRTSRQALAVLR